MILDLTSINSAVTSTSMSGQPIGVYTFTFSCAEASESITSKTWFDGSTFYYDPKAYGSTAGLNGLDMSVTANPSIIVGATLVEVGLFDSDTATTPIRTGECVPSMPYVQFPGLDAETTYYVRQRNVDANGAKTNWSIAFPVTTPAA